MVAVGTINSNSNYKQSDEEILDHLRDIRQEGLLPSIGIGSEHWNTLQNSDLSFFGRLRATNDGIWSTLTLGGTDKIRNTLESIKDSVLGFFS